MAPTNDVETAADGSGETFENYADVLREDPLVYLFGDHAKTRLLIALLQAPEPLSPSQIVEQADLESRTSWYRNKDDLLATGLVEQVDKVGNSPRFDLAVEDDRVEWLEKLRDFTVEPLKESREDDE